MDDVVGGAVIGRLKVTCRGSPAVSAAARGQVAPAQRSNPCDQALLRPVLGGGGVRNQLCCRRLLCGAGGSRLKASATTFSWPGVCLMSDVNLAMKISCRCQQPDQGGVVRNRDVTSGLWSVSRGSV